MPLWMSRLRSQKLLNAVLQYDDFPILLEAWRTCVQDEFDLEGLRKVLAELESGSISWSEVKTGHPSPMAQNSSWRQISQYMYMGDEPALDKETRLRSDLLRDVVYTPDLRPTISSALVEQFESKRQRLSPGYSPSSPRDLVDWVKERIIIPHSEWESLQEAMASDLGVDPQAWLESIGEKLVRITPPNAKNALIVSLEMMPGVIHAFYGRMENVDVETLSSIDQAPIMRTHEGDPDELLTSLLGEWLQFYGPTSVKDINKNLGVENQRLNLALEDLIDSEKLITGKLVTDGNDDDICDSENFEHLLRLSRVAAIPSFDPLEIEWLPLFLALLQGVAEPDDGMEGLFQAIEQLLCYQMPAALWEKEVIPARVPRYDTSKLDTIMQEGDLRWIGSENRRVALCFESDLDLVQEEGDGGGQSEFHMNDIGSLFPDPRGRYDFSTLLTLSKCRPTELADRLWGAVWAGKITNDTFMSIRRGIMNRFKVPKISETHARGSPRGRRTGRRTGFSRWKNTLPFGGNWFRITWPEQSGDLIEIEERNKDRVRLLLDRYGILFRELLHKELPTFRWSSLFRSLRLMELSGEVLSGYFFKAIPGPQFISHRAFQILQKRLPEEAIWWINATDPASLCGIPVDEFRGTLPKRLEGTHLVYHGKRLVLISNRNGKAMTILVPHDDPNVLRYMEPLHHLLTRSFQPMRRITIETINDEKAIHSPYVDALRTSFELMVDYKNVILYRK
jgi:ATP-dependent Lhr-like helicase